MIASPWWAWSGYGPYVWGSYALLALAVAVDLWSLRAPRGSAPEPEETP
ncbi:MAG TPA: heme exporter protein CcmD [Burkholderiaceae bacterium]|nr:heme exporter protein CcmD [Burkholderiaceae bacterium]